MLNPEEATRKVYQEYILDKKNKGKLDKYIFTKNFFIKLKLLSKYEIREIEKEVRKENNKK